MRVPATLLSLLASAASVSAFATVDYTIRPVEDGTIEVTMAFVADRDGTTLLKMPRWAPGAYLYSDPARSVKDLVVRTRTAMGATIATTNPTTNAWSFEGRGPLTVTYRVPGGLNDGSYLYNGPSTYLYIDGRKEEAATLRFTVPQNYRVATGLDPIGGRGYAFKAPNYDVLADNPVTMGDFLLDTYTVAGKPHQIVLRGRAKAAVDRQRLKENCEAITRMQGDFFGGLPYNRYVWHFNVYDGANGGGGLEHLSSTVISLASGVGPGTVAVMSHEFFHLWNVKRIRSQPLGPFDYDTLPATGALWWLEGVTDYYGHTLLPRYGIWTKDQLYTDVANNVRSVRSNPARLEVSPNEASLRVRDANNGRGNSQGYRLSYYDTGWLLGLVLDLAIIDESNGRESLDSVEKTLWSEAKDMLRPGFSESRLRELVVRYGGRNVGTLYDTAVDKPGEIAVEAALARAGLEMATVESFAAQLPINLTPNPETKALRVGVTRPGAPAALATGDKVVKVAGIDTTGEASRDLTRALARATQGIKVGEAIEIVVERTGGALETISIVPTRRDFTEIKIMEKPGATPRQLRVRELWMSKRRPGTAPR